MKKSGFKHIASADHLEVGQIGPIKLEGRCFLLANVDGEYFLSDEMCTHEDVSLALGCLKGEWIKCSLHGSQFNLRTGEVMDDPADEPLKVYPIQVEDGEIYAKID